MGRTVTEEQRLEVLRGYGLLDTPNEPPFDAIVRDAARHFAAPMALLALVDSDRQWFKARVGFEPPETPRAVSFCTHAIAGDGVLVVPDATLDARFRDNPNVLFDPRIRFYAGAPLRTPSGARIGTVCVADRAPRPALDAAGCAFLEALARRTVEAFERRRAHRTHRDA